jgi:nitrite reductase/ring-hydroxylating ferredoxin subunit
MNTPTPEAQPEAEPALPLCDARALEERGKAWVWDVIEWGRPARAFALRFDGEVRAYMNRCLHVPTEMDWQPGEFLDSDKQVILCSIHGAAYEPKGGRCVGGPCGRGALKAVRTEEKDGTVYWYPSRDIRPVVFDEPT